jgi:hypothetical protein
MLVVRSGDVSADFKGGCPKRLATKGAVLLKSSTSSCGSALRVGRLITLSFHLKQSREIEGGDGL